MIQCQYEVHISKNDTYSMDRPHFHEDIEIVPVSYTHLPVFWLIDGDDLCAERAGHC